MTPHVFRIETTPYFDRHFKKLAKRHLELPRHLPTIRAILQTDPHNRSREYQIKKLTGPQEAGQWRLRVGRWCFRYDIVAQTVELKYCGLRREDTYHN